MISPPKKTSDVKRWNTSGFYRKPKKRDGHASLYYNLCFASVFGALVENQLSVSCTEVKEKAKHKKSETIKAETVMEYSGKSRRIETASKGETIHLCLVYKFVLLFLWSCNSHL